MELRQLEYAVAVHEEGSFLAAARELGVSQPSLWRQVRALEQELGVHLFARQGRSVRLTTQGLDLLSYLQAPVDSAHLLRRRATEMSEGRAGSIVIECAQPHVKTFLAPVLGSFRQARPDVRLVLREQVGLPDVAGVVGGSIDFVTGTSQANGALEGVQLGVATLMVVVSDEHPWRSRSTVELVELRDTPVAVAGPQSLSRSLMAPALARHGIELAALLETSDPGTAVALACEGVAVAVVADDALGVSPETWPRLVDEGVELSSPIWLYWRRDTTSAAARALVAHVLSVQYSADR